MQLEIQTPDLNVFSGEISAIILPGIDGSFEIRSNHAPLISALKEGAVVYTTGGKKETVQITSGFVEVLQNNVVVLAESVVAL